ncbi:MAG: radical SAM protein [Longicatena sp.]
MNKISKYVIETKTDDNKYGLIYNTKNNYFIRYLLSDFKNSNELLNYPKIYDFLEEKNFIENDNEIEQIINLQKESIESNDTLMLILKITKDCNFRCIYCYENFKQLEITEDVQNGIIQFIENKIKNTSLKRVAISWLGGEPLLNLNCIEYMAPKVKKICEENNVKYCSTIVTNGFLLTSDVFEKLLTLGVNLFQITIDGPKSIHDMQRKLISGGKSYDIIKQNLYDISKSKAKFQVVLRTNISRKLLNNMDEYINDMLPLFKDKRFFAMYHPVVDFSNLSHEVTDTEVLNEMIYAMNKGFKFPQVTEYLYGGSTLCYGAKENHFVIDTLGQVSKCTETNEQYSIIGKMSIQGIIEPNLFLKLWDGARISTKCLTCNSISSCGGGACPLYYLKHGKPRCMKYKSIQNKEELLKIAEKQQAYNLTLHL